jgi:hypothetical protein
MISPAVPLEDAALDGEAVYYFGSGSNLSNLQVF